MSTAAIILARGGSKRLPHKHMLDLCGKPLIAWTIEQARDASRVGRVYVSTDDAEIAEVSGRYGGTVIDRPDYLARSTTTSEEAWLHAVDEITPKPDVLALLQCTSPIRQPDDIDKAICLLGKYGADSVYSCAKVEGYIHSRPDSSRCLHTGSYQENGSIYVIPRTVFVARKSRFSDRPVGYIMDPLDSFQVDTAEDFERIRQLMLLRLPDQVCKGMVST